MATMQAIQMLEFGAPEVLVLRETQRPEPGPGEVLVRLSHSGASFGDTYMRRGYYAPPHTYATHLPYIPGIDGYGEVAALGSGVTGWQVGETVAYCLGHHSYAQYAKVPAWKLVRAPRNMPPDTAVALMISGLTAHYLTHTLFPLKDGDWALLHAAAGSVGQMMLQMAKRRGARVIATVGTPEKAEIVRGLGADHVVLYREEDFLPRVKEITAGRGVDVAYDSVGLETYRRSMRALRVRGVCALYGAASGIPDCVRPMEDLAENGSIFVTRSHLAHYMRNAEEIGAAARDLFDYWQDGMDVAVDRSRDWQLADAAAVHAALENRETTGKIVMRVP